MPEEISLVCRFAQQHQHAANGLLQIVISANKEAVMSEKRMTAGFGQTIVVGYSEPVHSSQFSTLDQFAARVQQEWDQQWHRVYSARLEGECRLQSCGL